MKPQKRCNKAGCRELVDYDKGYCDKHLAERDKEYNKYKRGNDSIVRANGKTDKEIYDFYQSREWKRVRGYVLMRDNWVCQSCLRKGRVHKANLVDHIVELRSPQGWEKRLDVDNLEAMNRGCHNEKEHEWS
ncbi:HNH endonuclease [Enterococcus sp. AZ102]|uniref:HNH endonuclease n=1 Tax=Enterococcus sp. AZ102 TaxID=2774865 RepID=UPI003F21125A